MCGTRGPLLNDLRLHVYAQNCVRRASKGGMGQLTGRKYAIGQLLADA